jgi:hypothetical protein
MTTFGKIFVFIQFGVAMALLGVAIGVYANHINWEATIKEENVKIKDFAAQRDRAELRYNLATKRLGFDEGVRPQHQALYNQKLALARTGEGANGPAVTDVEYNPQNGALNVAGTKPIQFRGQDAVAYAPLQTELEKYNGQKDNPVMLGLIPTEQQNIKKLLDTYAKLTLDINGDGGMVRGLRLERALQEDAKAKAIAETEFLKPMLANRYAETVLLLKRQNSLTARKTELDKAGVAAAPTPATTAARRGE